jgi:hypothetical protein
MAPVGLWAKRSLLGASSGLMSPSRAAGLVALRGDGASSVSSRMLARLTSRASTPMMSELNQSQELTSDSIYSGTYSGTLAWHSTRRRQPYGCALVVDGHVDL